jgi:DNA-binding NarL/FixJ family response regulator
MTVPIRVILADDHAFFREGVAGILEGYPEIELVDQAADGRQLLSLVEKHAPDVVLTDIQMGPMDGFEATRHIRQRFPEVAVIALSMHHDNFAIVEMLRAGATGYLVKDSAKHVVVEAIRAAHRGQRYYSETASRKVTALISGGFFDPDCQDVMGFNPTELRIIRLMCLDTDNDDIIAQLNISNGTLKRYRQAIMDKAGVKTHAGLVFWAVKEGLVRW